AVFEDLVELDCSAGFNHEVSVADLDRHAGQCRDFDLCAVGHTVCAGDHLALGCASCFPTPGDADFSAEEVDISKPPGGSALNTQTGIAGCALARQAHVAGAQAQVRFANREEIINAGKWDITKAGDEVQVTSGGFCVCDTSAA